MSSQNPLQRRQKSKIDQFAPKLRKNKKLEFRWGNDYYEAVNKAVFDNDFTPYIPSEPPCPIKEDVDKTGYVCKQCRDCFRFLSSIEEHTSRRSWVLGYWCQSCFTTKCTHVSEGMPMCPTCRNTEALKHSYLAEKGAKRNLKKAVTRVFYNQCQFFAHLRMHGTTLVDLSEVMLMPLPSGIKREDYGQLDKLCRALMETMFIRRTHILDWLKEYTQKHHLNLQSNIPWTTLLSCMESKNKDPLTDIISRYSDNCLNPSDLAERMRKENSVRNNKDQETACSVDTRQNEEKDPLAEDDNSPNDIAFVDCGPTPSHVLISDFPDVPTSKKPNNGRTADRANSLWRSFSQEYQKYKEKSRELAPKSCEEPVESSSSATSMNRKNPRVLTIRSPKSLSLSTIIKHLPIDGISQKNIIVVADESKAEKSRSAQSESPTMKNPSRALEVRSQGKATRPVVGEAKTVDKINRKIHPATRFPDTALKGVPLITKNQSFSEQMSLHGRIMFQNGRKYIIRHLPKSKSQSLLQDPIVKKLRNPPGLMAPITRANIPLIPKPPQGPKITTISSMDQSQKVVTVRGTKYAKIAPKIMNPGGFSLAAVRTNVSSQNNKARITKTQKTLLIQCRESLASDLRRASTRELEIYIEHLKRINESYSKAMNIENDSVMLANMKAITIFEKVAQSQTTNDESSQAPPLARDIFDEGTLDWESQIKNRDKLLVCDTCAKPKKPQFYIVGVSNPSTHESLYCHCYNNVCYICDANQGSLIQLKAHVKWHKAEKPYMCPSCSIVFPSVVELEIHVWTSCFHPIARYIYGCGVCELEGIIDMESVAKHFLLLHTRRKILCTVCKMEFSGAIPSRSDWTRHFQEHHHDMALIQEPRKLLVCSLKQCIVRPELFRAHLSDHIGVLKEIYYKCPFCPVITQASGRNKALMRKHLSENHLDRMHEIVSNEALNRIIDGIKLTTSNPRLVGHEIEGICQVSNADPTGPKILDARTITPATFELGSEASEEFGSIDDSKLPRILEVRSEAVEEFESDGPGTNEFGLEIVSVKSVADDSPDSPSAIERDTSNNPPRDNSDELADRPEGITMDINSLLIRERIDCEDSSNSQDGITVISMSSKLEDSEPDDTSCLNESWDDNQESDSKEYITGARKEETLKGQKISRRPWRIALNNPSDVETEPIAYNCHVCGELINTSWSVMKNHFDTCHSSDYEIFTVSPSIPRVPMSFHEETEQPDDSSGNDKKRKIDISPPSGPKRRRRWGPKKHVEKPGSPSLGICVKQEPVQEIEGSFRCKKCDQLFEDRSMLRDHIAKQHRIKGQYLICLECGENFVVVPSLQMHLKALHGVEDPITYLTKNTAYAPEILDDTEEDEKATESNQCYVCMAVFEDKPALDKHIRVHGMAFLRRKRFETQKAMKSSAKMNDSNEASPEVGSIGEKTAIAEKSSNSTNMQGIREGNEASSIMDEKSSENSIDSNDKTIMEVHKMEPMT